MGMGSTPKLEVLTIDEIRAKADLPALPGGAGLTFDWSALKSVKEFLSAEQAAVAKATEKALFGDGSDGDLYVNGFPPSVPITTELLMKAAADLPPLPPSALHFLPMTLSHKSFDYLSFMDFQTKVIQKAFDLPDNFMDGGAPTPLEELETAAHHYMMNHDIGVPLNPFAVEDTVPIFDVTPKKPKVQKSVVFDDVLKMEPVPAVKLFTDDGLLTDAGVAALTSYATAWVVRGERDLDVERRFPDMAEEFYAVRADSEYAQRYAEKPEPTSPVKTKEIAPGVFVKF